MSMGILADYVLLSRLQFALTTMFHILWPVLTVGLSLFLVLMEALWIRTGDRDYYHHARFWSRLLVLNIAVGVVSGIPLEFQFGTNWSHFSVAGGDFFGHMLGFEGAIAFMLEASFLGVMMFGWKRVSPGMHLFATCMVALGASLSAFWIMVANSWMHTPTGGYFHEGRFVLTSHWDAIFNPDMRWGVTHMWVACLETSLVVVGGISAWYLLRNRHVEFFLKSFKIAVVAAIIFTPLQIWFGDGSGRAVAEHQPSKLAGMEGHWHTNAPGTGAPWSLLAWPNEDRQDNDWAIEIPDALSLLIHHSRTGQLKGLRDFPRQDQPPVLIPYYSFRIMAAIGFAFFALMFWTVSAWRRGRLSAARIGGQRKLLHAWLAAVPLAYLAVETGWATREVGRQPWALYGLLRTRDAASVLPESTVAASLVAFMLVYALLLTAFLVFARRIIVSGPDLEEGRKG
jgi:cytochrome bd ubiquinol oxidase subunit I